MVLWILIFGKFDAQEKDYNFKCNDTLKESKLT